MSLEGKYRSALRWYPKRWRLRNEDAVVGTLLDVAEEEHRAAPAKGELANLRANGLGARLDFVDRALPLQVRERVGVWMLGLGFALSVVGLFFGGWTWAFTHGSYRQVWLMSELGKNVLAGQGVYLLWVAAGIAAFTGARRVALWIVVASIPVSVAWPVIALHLGQYGHPTGSTLAFLDLVAILAIAGLGSPQPRLRSRASVSSLVGVILTLGTYFLRILSHGYLGNGADNVDSFWAPLAVWLVFLGIPAALVLACVFAVRGETSWAGIALWCGAPVLPLVVLAWGWRDENSTLADILTAAIILAAVIGALIFKRLGFRITITRA